MSILAKRLSALLLAICLFFSVFPQPALAAEVESDDTSTVEASDDDAASADTSDSSVTYSAPQITGINTVIGLEDSYVCITWDVVDDAYYQILRSTDGGEYKQAGYASYSGDGETEVSYHDTDAGLCHTYSYAVRCIDKDGNVLSEYSYTDKHYYPSGTCGVNVTWSLASSGLLTISGTGDMVDTWDESYAVWYPIRSAVTAVQIEEGVTSVAPYAFQDCANLVSVSLPGTVSKIGDCAFFGCTELTSVVIPEGVTEIPYRAFYLCSALTDITLPSTVTEIGSGAFGVCSSLTELALPDGLTSLGKSALYNCSSLTSLVIPDGVTVLPMNVLYGCTSLTSLTLPSGLTELGIRALFNCYSLTELELPDTLTTIGSGAFQRCSGLTELTIPASVTSIGSYAFYSCAGLESVTFLGAPLAALSNWFGDTECTAFVLEEYADAWFALDLTATGSQVTWSTLTQSDEDEANAVSESSQVESLDTPTVSLSNAASGVKVSWDAVNGAEGYYIYRKTSGSSWKRIDTLSSDTLSYTDTAVSTSSGTTYYYTVCAYAGSVISDYVTNCSILFLAQPSVSLANTSTGVKVSWG
ncbi:MAG: fibronectin type III domain-containing protein, partial [Clostridiales bacterium]|nr:fibronectin type III domain-containing protein [Clostridiales bacterium]